LNNKLFVIVPDLPPSINGLGDYAYLLANKLKINGFPLQIEFIVAGYQFNKFNIFNGFNVHALQMQTSKSLFQLLNNLNAKLVHLHYVGYGYAKRGAPIWLYLGLIKWRQQDENILITTFHELFANSKFPWTSSFWNQWVQKIICKKIYLASKAVFTSKESFKEELFSFNPFIDIYVLPVFSNFGEMNDYKEISLRDKGLIILGSSEKRLIVYEKYKNELNLICQKYSIDYIIDVGPKFGKFPILNVPIIEYGVLNPNEISDLLKKNSFGIIAGHKSDQFAKSGVFAAYASHGIVVFALDPNFCKIEDGINLNKHFVTIYSQDINNEFISKSIYDWYSKHSLEKQCKSYAKIFNFYNI